MNDFGCFLDGNWEAGEGGAFISKNPADQSPVWHGGAARKDQVMRAFAAARIAFPKWMRTPYDERIAIVRAYKEQIEANRDAFAELISRESGKAMWESKGEVNATIGKVELSIKAYEERTGFRRTDMPFGHAGLRHNPHGVMAVMGPYNFPAHLPNGHIVPALIAGNVVVFKPSELCPAVGAFMVRMWQEAGLPDGVLNLVQGGRDAGGALLDNPEVDGVLFTGSVNTGTFIHQKFAGRPEVILALEMGGNNPLVVWETNRTEDAANLVLQSAYITSGQRCTCARRLIVPEGKAGDTIIEALAAQIDRLVIAPWNADPAPFMSTLVSEGAAAMVLADQSAHVRNGARIVREGRRMDFSDAAITPSLLEMGEAECEDEETFGPLLRIYRAGDFPHAVDMANDTRFGLGACLISDDQELWPIFSRDIRAGVVNFNRPSTGAASSLPFGGPGISGNSRPGAWYAADYCAWPMASQEADAPQWIDTPGLTR